MMLHGSPQHGSTFQHSLLENQPNQNQQTRKAVHGQDVPPCSSLISPIASEHIRHDGILQRQHLKETHVKGSITCWGGENLLLGTRSTQSKLNGRSALNRLYRRNEGKRINWFGGSTRGGLEHVRACLEGQFFFFFARVRYSAMLKKIKRIKITK